MKWKNLKDTAPEDAEEVLIKCSDGFHVAVYDHAKNGFRLKGGATLTVNDCELYWVPIIFP